MNGLLRLNQLVHLMRTHIVSPAAWVAASRLRPGLLEDLLHGYGVAEPEESSASTRGSGDGGGDGAFFRAAVPTALARSPPPLRADYQERRRQADRATSSRRDELAALKEHWRLVRREGPPFFQLNDGSGHGGEAAEPDTPGNGGGGGHRRDPRPGQSPASGAAAATRAAHRGGRWPLSIRLFRR